MLQELDKTRMYLRLHLRFLLDLRSSPTVLPSLLSRHVETVSGPSKAHPITALRGFFHVRHVLMVDQPGSAPGSATPSL